MFRTVWAITISYGLVATSGCGGRSGSGAEATSAAAGQASPAQAGSGGTVAGAAGTSAGTATGMAGASGSGTSAGGTSAGGTSVGSADAAAGDAGAPGSAGWPPTDGVMDGVIDCVNYATCALGPGRGCTAGSCFSISGCGSAICIPSDLCEAECAGQCLSLDSYPGQLECSTGKISGRPAPGTGGTPNP